MQGLYQGRGRNGVLKRIYVSISGGYHKIMSDFALHEGAYSAFGIPNDFNVLDLGVFRQMLHQHASKFSLVDIRRETIGFKRESDYWWSRLLERH